MQRAALVAAIALGACSSPDVPLARSVVATYHAESTAAGLEMLAAGGNAFDAFVAATFVDYVVSPGLTSAAGPLGALVHVAGASSDEYLDGDLVEVLDPAGRWNGTPGSAFTVPGAVAALAALAERHGRLPLSQLLQPAIRAARDGFVLDKYYVGTCIQTRALLESSEYGRASFFPGGQPLVIGDTLRLPELADFLAGLAEQGPAYMYTGPWATQAVAAVTASGGKLTLADLARYRAEWREPRRTTYRGLDVSGPAGRAYGGLWALVGLEVLEHTDPAALGHYSKSADALELVVRTTHVLHEERWWFDPNVLEDDAMVAAKLGASYTTSLWERVQTKVHFTPSPPTGSHSFHVIVADKAGNVVTGTNTIESLPFGSGLFVQGVPLNSSSMLSAYDTGPGERRISPMSVHLVWQDGVLRAALGSFGSSMIENELEMLVDVIDYGMDGEAIAAAPRFGTYPVDLATGMVDVSKNWIDPRIPQEVIDELATRGLQFKSEPAADLGFGVVLTIKDREPSAGAIRTYGVPVSIEYRD